ncbi:MAG: LuxR C-terminal-related transcriptional regulator [Acidimicrobiales bacterium]
MANDPAQGGELRMLAPSSARPTHPPAPSALTVGRDHELAAVETLLDAGTGLLVLRGPLGIGKSHLAREAGARASDRGWTVVAIAGSTAVPGVPFAPWAHLLDDVPVDATPAALIAVALAHLGARRAAAPLLVVIEDAHRLDELSMAMAVHVMRRDDLAVLVTIGAGRAVPGPLAEVLRDTRPSILDLAPLDHEGLATLAASLGGTASLPGGIATLARVTGGNPLFAIETLRGGLPDGRATASLDDVIALRLAGLPAEQRRLLELLAVGGSLDARLAEDLVGEEAVVWADQAGLLVVTPAHDEMTVGLTHRLYAESLRSGLGVFGVRARLEELIAAATRRGPAPPVGLVQLATWHEELGVPFEPAATGLASRQVRWGFHDWLRRGLQGQPQAADPMSDTGRVDIAYRLARLAWEQDPDWSTGHSLLRSLLDQRERLDEFEPVLAATSEMCSSEEERATLCIVHALWLCWVAGRWPEAESMLLDWEQRLGSPHRHLLACARGGLMVQRGEIGAGMAVLDAHRPDESFPAATRVAWASPWAAGCVMAGRLDEGIRVGEEFLPAALELGDEAMVAVSELVLSGLWGRLYRGELVEAETRALAVRELAGDRASAEGLALLGGVAARSMLWQGRVAEAVELLEDAVLIHEAPTTVGFRPLLHTTLAVALCAAGRAGAPEQLVEAKKVWTPPRVFDTDLAIAEARIAASQGRIGVGAEIADAAAEQAGAAGNVLFALLAAHTAADLAPDPARRERLLALAAAVDGTLSGLLARECLLTASADPVAAEALGDDLVAIGAMHHAARAYVAAGQWNRTSGHRGRAARCEGAAARAWDACPGMRRERAVGPVVGVMTRRESEVAVLAAKGWSSADIADELGISVRTVESHLYRVFAKLGVTNRAELAAELGP